MSIEDKEYWEYLAELELEDDAAQEAAEKAERDAQEADDLSDMDEAQEDPKRSCMEEYWARVKAEKARLQREAFNQDLLPLHRVITDEEMQKLVELVAEPVHRFVMYQENYINRRFAKMLRPYIPSLLKACYRKYPGVVREHPGFLYQTFSRPQTLSFWATPKIPAYFKQGTEIGMLMEQSIGDLEMTDYAIEKYHAAVVRRNKKETKIVYKLGANRVKTFFDLVRVNPFWFDLIFKELTKKNE